jgi:GTPase
VRDASHADTEAQKDDVLGVLRVFGIDEENGNGTAPLIEVLNKSDLLAESKTDAVQNRTSRADQRMVLISARDGGGIDELLAAIDRIFAEGRIELELSIPWADGAELTWIYDHGEVLEREDGEDSVNITVRLSETDASRVQRRLAN